MAKHYLIHLAFLAIILLVSGCGLSTGGDNGGEVTKANVSRVTVGMGIDEAKLILGPPTHHAEVLHLMEWGSADTPGPYIVLDYDKDTLEITRKKVIGMD